MQVIALLVLWYFAPWMAHWLFLAVTRGDFVLSSPDIVWSFFTYDFLSRIMASAVITSLHFLIGAAYLS